MKTAAYLAPRLLLLAIVPLMAACNTIQGVGKDITAAGKAIERSTQNVNGNPSQSSAPSHPGGKP